MKVRVEDHTIKIYLVDIPDDGCDFVQEAAAHIRIYSKEPMQVKHWMTFMEEKEED